MIHAWRVVKAKHAAHALDGEGARLYGGRWTSKGIRVVYASQTLSLAVLEILVHLQSSSPLAAYVFYEIDFSESLVQDLPLVDLPENWRTFPAPAELQQFGDDWVRSGTAAVLRVPSAVLHEEYNYLINPEHQDFPQIVFRGPTSLEPDSRLFGRE